MEFTLNSLLYCDNCMANVNYHLISSFEIKSHTQRGDRYGECQVFEVEEFRKS